MTAPRGPGDSTHRKCACLGLRAAGSFPGDHTSETSTFSTLVVLSLGLMSLVYNHELHTGLSSLARGAETGSPPAWENGA